MKSERRHELQQNYLADYLGHWITRIEPHAKSLGLAIAVVVIGLIGVGFYRSSQMGARSDATLELLQNASGSDPEALGSVGQRYPGTMAGALAKLYQADALLAGGIAGLFEDRDEAQGRIEEAIKLYESVQQPGVDTLIRSRANLGLGRAHESLGQTDLALAAYNRLIEIGESDAIVKLAQQRIGQLKNPMTEEFLVWFGKQDFRPPTPASPPGVPGSDSLPDFPNFDLPDLSSLIPGTPLPTEATTEAAEEMTAPPAEDASAAPAASDESISPPEPTSPATEPAPSETPSPEPSETPATPAPQTEPPASEPAVELNPPADSPPPTPAPADPAGSPE